MVDIGFGLIEGSETLARLQNILSDEDDRNDGSSGGKPARCLVFAFLISSRLCWAQKVEKFDMTVSGMMMSLI